MNADDFRDYMLSFLFLRYLSGNYEESAKKELGADYPQLSDSETKAIFHRVLPNFCCSSSLIMVYPLLLILEIIQD
jgi:type I restriction-modification system DNA methylase subunit